MVEAPKPYKSDGIYDEIGKEPNGTCSTSKLDEIVPVHAENVYAVPNKPKKAASNGWYFALTYFTLNFVSVRPFVHSSRGTFHPLLKHL